MNKFKAAAIRSIYTMVETAIPVFTATTLTRTDVRIGIVATVGAGVLTFLSALKRDLPEVEDEPDMTVSPIIPNEEIIDTSEEDKHLKGGGVNE